MLINLSPVIVAVCTAASVIFPSGVLGHHFLICLCSCNIYIQIIAYNRTVCSELDSLIFADICYIIAVVISLKKKLHFFQKCQVSQNYEKYTIFFLFYS